MTKTTQPQPDTQIIEGVRKGGRFSGDEMAWPKLAKVAKRFRSDVFVAEDGVAVNAKALSMFRWNFSDDVTVGARGPDAPAAANAVAAFLKEGGEWI